MSANLTLPNWATNSVVEELRAIVGLHMGISFGGIDYQYRTELAPYAAGIIHPRETFLKHLPTQ